ncbi:acyl-CoA dehydrogenase family protein [Chloroflexota bacterium]
MNVNYTEEQEMLRAAARDFLEKECTDSVLKEIEGSGTGYSPELWEKIADLGWLGLVYPEQYSGSGMNLADLAVIYEEFGRAMFPSPYMSTVVLAGLTILEAGSEELKSSVLPVIATGEEIIALAVNEPELTGKGIHQDTDITSIKAIPDGDEYVLNGSKQFVQNAGIAGKYLVPAITGDIGSPGNGVTLFLVDSQSGGISKTYLDTVSGDSQYEVVFDNVRVPRENIIGTLNEGWTPLEHSLQISAMMSSAQMLGAGQQLLELTIEDAEARSQYDAKGIDKYTEEHIANLRRDVEYCRQVVYEAANKLEAGEPFDFEGTVVKGWRDFAVQNS